jgi:ABC-type multidrug transport system ATPase subunit
MLNCSIRANQEGLKPGDKIGNMTVDKDQAQERKMKLSISHLSKQYRRDFWGLRDFDIELTPGVIGLLGPNGAGKSTLMRMLATITQPTEGTVKWNDTDIVKSPDTLRAVLGYLPQDFGIYPNLTGVEFLEYMAAIKGMDAKTARRRIEELLVVVNLVNAAKRPLGGYSGGMKQRVGIAQALLNDPQLLIVDEPTVGLDPEERVRFRNLLSDLAGERIIILSTHIVSDVEATSTEIVIINKGHKIEHAAPEKLLALLDGKVWQWVIPSEALTALKQKALVSGTIRRENGIQVRVVSEASPASEAEMVTPSLEDVYLHLVSGNGVRQ